MNRSDQRLIQLIDNLMMTRFKDLPPDTIPEFSRSHPGKCGRNDLSGMIFIPAIRVEETEEFVGQPVGLATAGSRADEANIIHGHSVSVKVV